MGCNESKGNSINNGGPSDSVPDPNHLSMVRQSSISSLPLDSETLRDVDDDPTYMTGSAGSSGRGTTPHTPEDSNTPNGGNLNTISDGRGSRIPSALEHIPSSDLGESLDVRKALRLFNSEPLPSGGGYRSGGKAKGLPRLYSADEGDEDDLGGGNNLTSSSSYSNRSHDSEDSGISDPGEDYSFVITENSPPELVKRVEQDFTPLEGINLIITGKACPRMLSGYQKSKQEEAAILDSLRAEGFITTTKTKSAGGVSFEVIEATPAQGTISSLSAGSHSSIKIKDFLPLSAQKKLDESRHKYGPPSEKTEEHLAKKRAEAEERRQAELEARQEKMAELCRGVDKDAKLKEIKEKHEGKVNTALQKREAHLKELRDKLKAQNQRAQHVKLKQLMIDKPPVPVPMSRDTLMSASYGNDSFFD